MEQRPILLVVEDEAINRKILKKLLVKFYDILEAENGQEAMDILMKREKDIAAILLDIVMPVMNGYQVMEQIKEQGLEDIPVIVMTGETDRESERKALDAGAWDFVAKPYDAKILVTRISNAIARSKMSMYKEIKHLSEYDTLTGLFNRRKMFAETKKMIQEHPDKKFIFLRADIDHFALFNSSFGEAEGDNLLRYFAEIFVKCSGEYEVSTYGRINADVLCACVPCTEETEEGLKAVIAERVAKAQMMLEAYPRDYLLQMSLGVYPIEDPTIGMEECYLRASMGSQRCKNQFGQNVGFYDAEFGERVTNEISIANEMQTALDEEQFVVYLQPKYCLSTESACGAEALVRWQHPTKGLISPGVFIPVFERNGFIGKLDYYVWEKTCQMLRKWIDMGKTPCPVSVNISRISLYNPQLVRLLLGLVYKYEINTALLQLEITESAYMTNPDQMQETIHALHAAGFTILMDDFGSGYSSLNTLKTMEVDILKIDMKFLPTGKEMEKGEIILATVIRMANWIGMSVVVEGIESRRQRDFVEGAGCDCVQGYYYSRPIPQSEYEENYILPDNQTEPVEQSHMESAPKHNVTILVIDDSEMDGVILRSYLEKDYVVHICHSAESGLAYLQKNKNKVRLILVDNVMPGMSGMDFLKYCQRDMSLQSIPKIMITSDDCSQEQSRAFQAGAYDYITKPLVQEVVIARINHVMEINNHLRAYEDTDRGYRHQTELDSVTGLMNKIAFQKEAVAKMVNHPNEQKALLVIDVDNFRGINEEHGQLMGDKILNIIAAELLVTFHKADSIGRFGGDEFVVLLTALSDMDIAKRKAEELMKSVAFACAEKLKLDASISVGIGHYEITDSFDTLFARADQALYEARTQGKGKVVVYGEQVPPVGDDDKPLVLICGEDPQLFPAIALSYGKGASFASITTLKELRYIFEKYSHKICAICLDMKKKIVEDAEEFYEYILANGGGDRIPILVVCREGDMNMLKQAVELKVTDILTLPPQMDIIRRRLSRAIMYGMARKDDGQQLHE